MEFIFGLLILLIRLGSDVNERADFSDSNELSPLDNSDCRELEDVKLCLTEGDSSGT